MEISPIPLGGYVKMLDEREMDVPAHERHLAFNAQPVSRRMAIVAAGPLANLLLAVLLYMALFMSGVNWIKPGGFNRIRQRRKRACVAAR